MSKQKSRKTKKRRPPIILPQAFAAAQSGQGMPLLSGQQTKHIQELIDLLKKNNLTELELERDGLRIRVRYEIGVKAITTTVADQGKSGSTSASQLPAAVGSSCARTSRGVGRRCSSCSILAREHMTHRRSNAPSKQRPASQRHSREPSARTPSSLPQDSRWASLDVGSFRACSMNSPS